MQRRDFLRKTAAVLSSAPLTTLAGAAAETSVPSTVISIHEKFITNDRVSVAALAQAIVGGRYRFLDSTQADFFVRFADLHDLDTCDNSAWPTTGANPGCWTSISVTRHSLAPKRRDFSAGSQPSIPATATTG